MKTEKSLEESDSSTNDQKEFFTTSEEQLQKAHKEITAQLKKLKQWKNLKSIQNKIKELETTLKSNSFKSQENDSINFRQTKLTLLLNNRLNTIDDVTAIKNSSWIKNIVKDNKVKVFSHKLNNKFKTTDMQQWENFIIECNIFHQHQLTYFSNSNHQKMLEVTMHLNTKLKIKWQNYIQKLSKLLFWTEFVDWLKKQIMNSHRAACQTELKFHDVCQHEHQFVSDFVTHLENLEAHLTVKYTEQ